MAFSIFHNAVTDRQYKAATGLSIAQFEQLYCQFAPFYTPKTTPRYAKQIHPVLTNKKEALFFILHYYKSYPTIQNLGMYFGISDFATSTYLELLKPCLKAALHQQGTENRVLVPSQEAFDKQFAGITDLIIDVTEVPIECAVNQDIQQERYSGKKISYVKMAADLHLI